MRQTGLNSATADNWTPRLAAFVLAALAMGSAVYWYLKLPSTALPDTSAIIAGSARQTVAPPDAATLARALGADSASAVKATQPAMQAVQVNVASRMALQGVIASGSRAGTALIAIDGKPAKAFRVGSVVEGDLVLQAVKPREALLGSKMSGPASATLQLMPVSR